MTRTKASASKSSGKHQSNPGRGESTQLRRRSLKNQEASEAEKFQNMNFWAERGLELKGASNAFTSIVSALGWERLVQHPKFFYASVVREFYEGIPPPKDGKQRFVSKVRGVAVDFDSLAINASYGLDFHSPAFGNAVANWRKKEMEGVKRSISLPGTPWEPCSANEFKIKRQYLTHDAKVWFNFIKQSLLPTSHATNVEKERMMLLNAILTKKNADIGRMICREIMVCKGKTAGYLFFPCLITSLCINAGVEIRGEQKSFPMAAFPTVLREKSIAAASGEPTMLPQFMLQQRAVWEFMKKQQDWLGTVLAANVKELSDEEAPAFPEWVLEDDCMEPEAVEKEVNVEAEPEIVVEKKRKRQEIKKGKKKQTEPLDEEDMLESADESLSDEEKDQYKEIMEELNKESDEEDPDTSEEEEEHDEMEGEEEEKGQESAEVDGSDSSSKTEEDPNASPDDPLPAPTTEQSQPPPKSPTPEHQPQPRTPTPPPQTPATQTTPAVPSATTATDAAATADAAACSEMLISPKQKRTKRITKKRKTERVPEEAKINEEARPVMPENEDNSVIAAITQGIANAAANEAIAKASADREKAEAAKKAKEAREFVLAQKKASVSDAGPVVADTGSVLQHTTAAATEATNVPKPAEAKSSKPTSMKQGKSTPVRASPRTKPGTPAP